MKKQIGAMAKLISSMLIFGSIGLLVRYIPVPSSVVAFVRAFVGVIFLLIVLMVKGTKLSLPAIKNNLVYLSLSGIAIGFNWILLFESYRYTSVAVSTLCYYMAPIIVTLLSPLILKEKITAKRLLCVLAALGGMALISGIFKSGSLQSGETRGIVLGLSAAVLYATVILLNKQLRCIGAMDRTVCQLLVAAVILLPYNLLSCDIASVRVTPSGWILLAVAGVIHTGLAYYLYFGSMEHLSGQSIALASFIDPVVAVLISITILAEPFDVYTVVGAAAILGAAVISELPMKKRYPVDHNRVEEVTYEKN